MKLANFFLLLISFNLISLEPDQLDVDFLSDDEYRIDLIFIKYLKDEDLKENFQNPVVNFERFFVALDEFQYPNLFPITKFLHIAASIIELPHRGVVNIGQKNILELDNLFM